MKENLQWEVHGHGVLYTPRSRSHIVKTVLGYIALAIIMWCPTIILALLTAAIAWRH